MFGNLRILSALLLAGLASSQPRPFPRVQAIPQPDFQISFQRDGAEIARYFFGPGLKRPFVFPVIGPSGRAITRMGHPHDPEGHSHHNSVWISHNDVNGVNFWADAAGTGRVLHQRIVRLDDGADEAAVITENAWTGNSGTVVLRERRRLAVHLLAANEWLLLVDLELRPEGRDAVFGKTPFGLIGVRMAKTIGVNDGGGSIRNSEGQVDEPQVFWKRARWVDYSGPITEQASEGITLFDHPGNPNHPSFFHVRRDGWMGSSFTLDAPRTLPLAQTLRLRYGLYIHSSVPAPEALQARWREFTAMPLADLNPKQR